MNKQENDNQTIREDLIVTDEQADETKGGAVSHVKVFHGYDNIIL
jgi:hypothetical protein